MSFHTAWVREQCSLASAKRRSVWHRGHYQSKTDNRQRVTTCLWHDRVEFECARGRGERGTQLNCPRQVQPPALPISRGVQGGETAEGQAADRVIPAEPSGVSGIFEAMLKTLLKESGARSFG